MFLLTAIFLQEAAGGSNIGTLILFGGMFVVMYFFFIRPQQKRAKEAKKYRDALAKGDKVVTIGGVHGKIVEINEATVVIAVEQGKLRVEKSAISSDSSASDQQVAQRKA